MTGKDIIKYIAENNGYDTDYDFTPATKVTNKYEKQTPKNFDDLLSFDIDTTYNEIIMTVSDPIAARKYGLSDIYKVYIWDGNTMSFGKNIDTACDWHISYGGDSTTMITEHAEKIRNTAATKMIEVATKTAAKHKPIPDWMAWRVDHFNKGLPRLNIFE